MNLAESLRISEETINGWQMLLDLMAEQCSVPAALIMKVDLPNIQVFLSSNSHGNPYKTGDSECLSGSGLYCERVIKTKTRLMVPNALKDEEWDNNPDIKLGMISYIGFPILWPNGNVFGTICMLDSKECQFNQKYCNALPIFKEYIENYLSLAESKILQSDRKEIFEKETRCEKLLLQIEKLLELR